MAKTWKSFLIIVSNWHFEHNTLFWSLPLTPSLYFVLFFQGEESREENCVGGIWPKSIQVQLLLLDLAQDVNSIHKYLPGSLSLFRTRSTWTGMPLRATLRQPLDKVPFHSKLGPGPALPRQLGRLDAPLDGPAASEWLWMAASFSCSLYSALLLTRAQRLPIGLLSKVVQSLLLLGKCMYDKCRAWNNSWAEAGLGPKSRTVSDVQEQFPHVLALCHELPLSFFPSNNPTPLLSI